MRVIRMSYLLDSARDDRSFSLYEHDKHWFMSFRSGILHNWTINNSIIWNHFIKIDKSVKWNSLVKLFRYTLSSFYSVLCIEINLWIPTEIKNRLFACSDSFFVARFFDLIKVRIEHQHRLNPFFSIVFKYVIHTHILIRCKPSRNSGSCNQTIIIWVFAIIVMIAMDTHINHFTWSKVWSVIKLSMLISFSLFSFINKHHILIYLTDKGVFFKHFGVLMNNKLCFTSVRIDFWLYRFLNLQILPLKSLSFERIVSIKVRHTVDLSAHIVRLLTVILILRVPSDKALLQIRQEVFNSTAYLDVTDDINIGINLILISLIVFINVSVI